MEREREGRRGRNVDLHWIPAQHEVVFKYMRRQGRVVVVVINVGEREYELVIYHARAS